MFFHITSPGAAHLLECPGSRHGRGGKKSALKIVNGLRKQLQSHRFFNLIRSSASDASVYANFFYWKFEIPWSHFDPLEIFWRSRRSRRSLRRSRRSLSRSEEIFKARSRPRSRFISILQDFGRIFLPKSLRNVRLKDSRRIQSRPAVKMLCFFINSHCLWLIFH